MRDLAEQPSLLRSVQQLLHVRSSYLGKNIRTLLLFFLYKADG